VHLKVDAARKALAAKSGRRKPTMDSLPASVAGFLAVPTTVDVNGEGLNLPGDGSGKDSKKTRSSKKSNKNKNKKYVDNVARLGVNLSDRERLNEVEQRAGGRAETSGDGYTVGDICSSRSR
jgi:hypothetical protein